MSNTLLNPENDTEQPLDFAQYLHVVWKRKWLIAICVIVAVSLALLHNAQLLPVYRATATMLIENQVPKVFLPNSAYQYQNYLSQIFDLNTHIQLLTSREVLTDVARRLNLQKLDSTKEKEQFRETGQFERYLPQFTENFRRLLGKEVPPRTPVENAPTKDDRLARLSQVLKGMISVERIEDTLLLHIHANNVNPSMARDLANTTAEAYIEFKAKSRLNSARNTLDWLTDQLYEIKMKLENAEAEFLQYKQSAKLVSVENRQKVIGQKITDFNDAYLQARNRRLELEAKIAQLGRISNSGEELPRIRSLIGNTFIESLYTQFLDSQMELSRLKMVYKARHPKIIQSEDHIRDIRMKLEQEIQKERSNLVAERSLLAAREEALQKTMGDFESEAMATNKKELQSTILERNVTNYQRLYDALLTQVKEADMSKSAETTTIRIVEAALVPQEPVGPNKNRNVAMAVIFGLIIGVGLGFFLEYMDRTFRTEEAVEKFLGIPVLAVIPDGEKDKSGGYGAIAPEAKNRYHANKNEQLSGQSIQEASET